MRAKELIEQYQAAMRTAPVQTMMPPAPAVSSADEIEKLAALRARGILTEEEFAAKKRQILGM